MTTREAIAIVREHAAKETGTVREALNLCAIIAERYADRNRQNKRRPRRRPCKLEWVESIVEQCRTAGVPVFVKQLDIGGKCVTDINKFPEHLRIRQVPWTKDEVTE